MVFDSDTINAFRATIVTDDNEQKQYGIKEFACPWYLSERWSDRVFFQGEDPYGFICSIRKNSEKADDVPMPWVYFSFNGLWLVCSGIRNIFVP